MQRVTRSELETVVKQLNDRFPIADFDLDKHAAGYRLVRKAGSVDVSPRCSAGELRVWIAAFLDGADFSRYNAFGASKDSQ